MDFPVRFFFLLLQHPQTVYLLIWLTDDLLDEQVGEANKRRSDGRRHINEYILLKKISVIWNLILWTIENIFKTIPKI